MWWGTILFSHMLYFVSQSTETWLIVCEDVAGSVLLSKGWHQGKGKAPKGGDAPSSVVGGVYGVRGHTPGHQCAGAIGLQRSASARGYRYDEEALRDSRVQGVRGSVPRRADGVVLGPSAGGSEGVFAPVQEEAAVGILVANRTERASIP